MKKILLISFSNLPNFQSSLYNSQENLEKSFVEVYTIGSSRISANKVNLNSKNYLVDVPENPMPSFKSFLLLNAHLKRIKEIILEINPDCIHFISKHSWNYFLVKVMKKQNIKIFHTFHDPIGHTGELRRFGVIFYNLIMGQIVDNVIVHSIKSYNETKKIIRPKGEVYRIPLGEMNWKEYKECCEFKKKVLIFGRLNPYKGCDLIPLISKELFDRNPNIKIIIAGKASKDIDNSLLEEIENCENVEFTNEFIEDSKVDDYFENCDAVLITHRSITQSGVILQAYNYSKPIIAFNINGIEEFIIENETCLLANKFEVTSYVDQILSLYNDLKLLGQFSQNAWNYGKENYSNECMSKKLLELYEKEGA